ncbi:MAG TPA: ABC transporter ATP-binding protein [Isosphaeraceae bacterium]|nr:ABC transporter ATP-binding protein [Isosphaeraceae bacterium]
MSDQPATAHDAPILRADGLAKYYPDGHVQALRGVSLQIEPSESVAITGPSGCGKSTLLHLLGGLDRPTQGDVFFREEPLSKLDIDAFRAHQVGFVFQSFYLMPTLTALENIQIPMFEGPWPPRQRGERALRLIEEVGLADRRDHRPGQLSVGQRQRIAIARALANDPQLLLADEPTGNLDSKSQDEIIHLLHRLRDERRLTLVIVTHSHDVARAADRRIPMKDGQIQPE